MRDTGRENVAGPKSRHIEDLRLAICDRRMPDKTRSGVKGPGSEVRPQFSPFPPSSQSLQSLATLTIPHHPHAPSAPSPASPFPASSALTLRTPRECPEERRRVAAIQTYSPHHPRSPSCILVHPHAPQTLSPRAHAGNLASELIEFGGNGPWRLTPATFETVCTSISMARSSRSSSSST